MVLVYRNETSICKQIIWEVPVMCISTLWSPITGYSNINTQQMLFNIYTNYGKLVPEALLFNKFNMKQDYNSNTLFEAFVKKIDEAVLVV